MAIVCLTKTVIFMFNVYLNTGRHFVMEDCVNMYKLVIHALFRQGCVEEV